MKHTPVELRLDQPGVYEQVFRDGETVLLRVQARWPRLQESGPGLKQINRYYAALSDRWKQRWEGPVLARAKAAAGPETPPWEASLDFTVTLFQDGMFSLYWDCVEAVGSSRPRRIRQGDTWYVPDGVPVTLRELLPYRRWWRGPVLEQVRRQIGQRVSSGESIFWENWPQLASRHFSAQRFYLSENGPVLFYPEGVIAPAMEGFPSFLLEIPERASPSGGSPLPAQL